MNATTRIVETIKYDAPMGWKDRSAITAMLARYGNADKVLRVMELDGSINQPNAVYTIAPIITGIGDRSPEQYVADVDAAVKAFEADYTDYMVRFAAAPTNRERETITHQQAVKWGLAAPEKNQLALFA